MPDPETGEPINVSHMIPRSREDLERRHGCLQRIAEHTRRPDGPHARLHERHLRGLRGRADEWGANGNERGRGEPRRVPEGAAPQGPLAHAHDHPPDRRQGDGATSRPAATRWRCTRSETPSTASSCAARASWRRSRRSPTSSPSIPAHPVRPKARATRSRSRSRWRRPASSSCVATAVSRGTNRFDHPLSSRFDEQDAFVIFDDVEVPRERLFIDGQLDVYNQRDDDGLVPERHAADDDSRADQARVRLRARLQMAEAIGDSAPATPSCSASCSATQSSRARRSARPKRRPSTAGNGVWFPNGAPLTRCAHFLPHGCRA